MNWIYLLLGFFIGLYLKSLIENISMKITLKILFGDEEVNKAVRDDLTGLDTKSKFAKRVKEMQDAQENKKAT